METREEWLIDLKERLIPIFIEAGAKIPRKVRISCGFPAYSPKALGQCWPKGKSTDETYEIFISPYEDDSLKVADTLVHELVHAAVGTEAGHLGEFKRLALAVGLKKPVRTGDAGEKLKNCLNKIIQEIGPYPHAKLNKYIRGEKGSRLLRVSCPACAYPVRVTREWLNKGTPVCPCGTKMTFSDDKYVKLHGNPLIAAEGHSPITAEEAAGSTV